MSRIDANGFLHEAYAVSRGHAVRPDLRFDNTGRKLYAMAGKTLRRLQIGKPIDDSCMYVHKFS